MVGGLGVVVGGLGVGGGNVVGGDVVGGDVVGGGGQVNGGGGGGVILQHVPVSVLLAVATTHGSPAHPVAAALLS